MSDLLNSIHNIFVSGVLNTQNLNLNIEINDEICQKLNIGYIAKRILIDEYTKAKNKIDSLTQKSQEPPSNDYDTRQFVINRLGENYQNFSLSAQQTATIS